MEYITHFSFLGRKFRTNLDATVVEALDGSTWNRTYSLSILELAKRTVYPYGHSSVWDTFIEPITAERELEDGCDDEPMELEDRLELAMGPK